MPSDSPEPGARSRAGRLALAALLAGSAALGIPAQEPIPPAPPRRPNLLLITLDTLRPDALGWVAGANATPALDRLAAGGFRFPAAVSPVPVTLPSHTSLLSGRIPRRHGVRDNGQLVGAGFPLLAEILRDAGYTTAAWVSGFPLDSEFGLDRGFAHYDDTLTHGRGGRLERPAAETTAAVLAWAAAKPPEPWFLWVHYYDPHDPYEPPPEHRRPGPRGAYDGEVAAADRAVGDLLDGLAGRLGAPLLTVFTGDHGESLGEHGENTHGFFLYQSTVAVPLVFRFPGRVRPGESAAPARLVDVLPTVLELLGQPVPPDLDGVSLVPMLTGAEQEIPPAYLETLRPWISYRWAPLRAVRDGRFKLVAAPRPELYDLTADPGETVNRVRDEPATAHRLAALVREIEAREAASAASASDPETLARLRALGYVGGGTPPPDRPPPDLPDPKDRVELWNALGEAEAQLDRRDFGAALERFDAVLEEDPDNPFALARSAAALVELGRLETAAARLGRAAELDPDQPETRRALAGVLTRLKRLPEAEAQWMELLRLQPRNVETWVSLANTLGAGGEPKKAVEAFERAVELAPERPDLRIRLGFAAFAAGDPEAAAAHLRAAAELTGPEAFPHAGALGLILLRLERPGQARPWLARSRPGEAEFAEARYALARLEAAAGRTDAARKALAEALGAVPGLRERAAADAQLGPLLP
jgi:arylsulfatase A-like enzyme/Tfp pilus assembly protein PilF